MSLEGVRKSDEKAPPRREQAVDEDTILKPVQIAKSYLTDSGYWRIHKKKDKEKKKRDKNLTTNQNKT